VGRRKSANIKLLEMEEASALPGFLGLRKHGNGMGELRKPVNRAGNRVAKFIHAWRTAV
jgi:hypothetical protein